MGPDMVYTRYRVDQIRHRPYLILSSTSLYPFFIMFAQRTLNAARILFAAQPSCFDFGTFFEWLKVQEKVLFRLSHPDVLMRHPSSWLERSSCTMVYVIQLSTMINVLGNPTVTPTDDVATPGMQTQRQRSID
jgi:hypothetical protein